MKNEKIAIRWFSWMASCILIGLAVRLGMWCMGRDPGLQGTLAAMVGAFGSSLCFNLARGSVWGGGGLAFAGYGAAGYARDGSVVGAIVVGTLCGLSIGLVFRLFDRIGRKLEAAGSKPGPPIQEGALGPWNGE